MDKFTQKITAYIFQYYTASGLPGRKLEPGVCAVCGNQIIVHDNDEAIIEKTYKLTCDHVYPSTERARKKEFHLLSIPVVTHHLNQFYSPVTPILSISVSLKKVKSMYSSPL